MKKMAIVALSAFFSMNAFANNSVVYSCTTTDNQTLKVTKEGGNYVYSHGDTTFKNPVKEALKNPASEIAGGSQFTTISLELRNAGKSYIVGHIEADPKSPFEASVQAKDIKTGNSITSFECRSDKPIRHNFDRKLMRKSGFAA